MSAGKTHATDSSARERHTSHPGLKDAHPLLRELFAAFAERRLAWLLLRYPADLAAPTGDVDLLVAPEDCEALLDAARQHGFVALPGWEKAPRLLLVRYDRPSDRWLVIDVVTTIAFRAAGRGSRELARAVLGRRQVRRGISVPADADAYWLLLLHCLLDKGFISPRYRRRLADLAPEAARSTIAATVLATHPARRSAPRFAGVGRALARARRLRLLGRRRGLGVALLGPDGVGKSTLAADLQRSFPFESRVVYMGLWQDGGGLLGTAPLRPLRIWWRYLLALSHRLRGRLVLFDRYVYEAALPSQPPFRALKRPYHWLLRHAVPRADVAVLLDVPGATAYARKQERSPDELERERQVYRRLARSSAPAIELVDASRDLDAVRADVMAIVWRRSARRWGGDRERTGPEAPPPMWPSVDERLASAGTPSRMELAQACSLVPRILVAEAETLPPAVARSRIAGAQLTDTRMTIVKLAPAGEPSCAIVKLPLTEAGARELRREGDALAALHGDERLGDWRRLIPRPLAAGSVLDQPYRVDSLVPGRELLARLADRERRGALLETAAEAIDVLHRRTAAAVTGDEDDVKRWVDAPLADLVRAGAARDARFASRSELLRAELHAAVVGCALTTSWIHGDYWPGNVLLSPDGATVEGIVDWDGAAPGELPLHDLLHLVMYTRCVTGGHGLGQVVRGELRAPRPAAAERGLLDRYVGWPPGGLPSYRHALLLYWLRHVALHARQQGPSPGWRYRLWERRNVHAVLRAL